MGKGKAELRAARREYNEKQRGRTANEAGASYRTGSFASNWLAMTPSEYAKANPHVGGFNFANGWTWSDTGKKYTITNTKGYQIVMDTSMAYYRVLDPTEQYLDDKGQPQAKSRFRQDNDGFMAHSHFLNQSAE
ncbi:MAG: hypothetical protein KF866_02370 [Phycisphaeraceae bacterium]|nr:hypothetical protein [Phycisphaeraceae bacterium]MCW5753461.1 hypothetical protein [Phycisphaeraceae bacterium]